MVSLVLCHYKLDTRSQIAYDSFKSQFSGVLDDTYALCEACEQPLSSLLSLMDVYRKELDFIVLSKLINVRITFVFQ